MIYSGIWEYKVRMQERPRKKNSFPSSRGVPRLCAIALQRAGASGRRGNLGSVSLGEIASSDASSQ
jgi:hypothetical protein